MRFGKIWLSPMVLVMRFYQFLGLIWFIPFGYYGKAIFRSGTVPHPFRPRTFRDLIINKMMFPDNLARAIVADKISARGYAMERIGPDHAIPTLGIFGTHEELRNMTFPYPYVVKTNHASGLICFVKTDADYRQMLVETAKWDMHEYRPKYEWTYRNIKARFMVEKMLVNNEQPAILDIKFFCFHSEPVLVHHVLDREGDTQKIFMTPDWKHVKIRYFSATIDTPPPRPEMLDRLLDYAKTLSADFDFIRVDFMVLGDHIYFGEMTNFPVAGQKMFEPHSYDKFLYQEYLRIGQEKIARERDKYHAMLRG